MPERQYVACEFKPGDRRTYTYHNDGPPVAPGDRVTVEGGRDGGTKAVTVVTISDVKPPFATKPILGMAEMPPAEPVDRETF